MLAYLALVAGVLIVAALAGAVLITLLAILDRLFRGPIEEEDCELIDQALDAP